MEMSTKLLKNQINNRLDNHDLALECCGYLKTKLFMAKRISDQQLEIDELKDSLFHLTLKYTNLLEFIKNEKTSEKTPNLNRSLEERSINNSPNGTKNQNDIQLNKSDKVYLDENDDEIDLAKSGNTSIHNVEGIFNLSNDCKSVDLEKNNISPVVENKAQTEIGKEEAKPSKFIPDSIGIEEEIAKVTDKRIKLLEEENFSLRKTNDNLLGELNKCKLELSKVSYEKLSLFSELNELLETLSKVDLDELNKFYFESLNHNLTKSSIFSAMGIKYNISSASNSIGLHAINSSFSFNIANGDFLKKKEYSNTDEKTNCLGQIFSEKYLLNIREKFHKYDEDLNNYVYYAPDRINKKGNICINRISNRKNVNYNSSRISSVCFDSETKTDI